MGNRESPCLKLKWIFSEKFECNLTHVEVQIWVQSFLVESKYQCKLENRVEHFSPSFPDNLVKRKISMFAVIYVPCQKRLKSYLDPFIIGINLIFEHQRDQDCIHNMNFIYRRFQNQDFSHRWTQFKLTLKSCLDPILSFESKRLTENFLLLIEYLMLDFIKSIVMVSTAL